MRYLFGFLCVCALGVMPLVGCSDTQPECETSADCNDDNECTNDVCDSASGTCSNTPVDDGTVCSFNGISGVCVSGACAENLCEGVVCEDDGNECTDDVCNFSDGTCNIPVGDGMACSDGACLNGACTALVAVQGIVFLYEGSDPDPPAVDATVSVHGTSLSTTTDGDGRFSFDVFMGDWFFQTSKEDTWGFFQLETVPTAGRNDLDLAVAADALAAQLAEDLNIAIDDTKGLVSLTFLGTASGDGGETATLSEQYEHASAADANGDEVLSETLLRGGGYELLFYNVDLTEELTVTPRGVDGVNECGLKVPGTLYPVEAKFATSVGAVCTDVR